MFFLYTASRVLFPLQLYNKYFKILKQYNLIIYIFSNKYLRQVSTLKSLYLYLKIIFAYDNIYYIYICVICYAPLHHQTESSTTKYQGQCKINSNFISSLIPNVSQKKNLWYGASRLWVFASIESPAFLNLVEKYPAIGYFKILMSK